MGFRITSSINGWRHARGLTLAEMLVSIAIGTIVVIAITSLAVYSATNFAGIANYTEMESSSLHAIDQMTKDIRQTTGLTSYSSNQLTFANGTNGSLIFAYSPGSRTLTRQQGTNISVLLKECDSFQFSLYQRSPVAGTFDEYGIGSATNECKVVFLNWVCSRQIFGVKLNTENAQTAKIVIRAL